MRRTSIRKHGLVVGLGWSPHTGVAGMGIESQSRERNRSHGGGGVAGRGDGSHARRLISKCIHISLKENHVSHCQIGELQYGRGKMR